MDRLPLVMQLLVAAYLPSRSIVLLRGVHRSLLQLSRTASAYTHDVQWRPQSVDELRAVLAAAASDDTDTEADGPSGGSTRALTASWIWPAASLCNPPHQHHRALVASLASVSLERCQRDMRSRADDALCVQRPRCPVQQESFEA